jgi:NADPH2:quinone reductase
VQLARQAEVAVVAAAGGAAKAGWAAELGVDFAVDYLDPAWTRRVREEFGAVDVVFDGVGGDLGSSAAEVLVDGGRRIVFGMASGRPADAVAVLARGITDVAGFRAVRGPDDNRALVEQALAAAADGSLRPTVGQVFPLEAAAEAHRAIEARTTIGKTLLIPTSSNDTTNRRSK